jgi:hypothetical protein
MRWAVRDVASPFDVLGYVEAPPPNDLALSRFRFSFRISRWMNDHPLHFEEQTRSTISLEVGAYRRHGDSCSCGDCPSPEAAFLSMGHPLSVLRHIVGFVPHTVIRVAPVGLGSGASQHVGGSNG